MDWRWLGWQVGLPLLGPVVFVVVVILANRSVDPTFVPQFHLAWDNLSYWTVTVYSLTLLAPALNEVRNNAPTRPLFVWIVFLILAAFLYAALLVLKQHDPRYVEPVTVGIATWAVAAASVYFAYRANHL